MQSLPSLAREVNRLIGYLAGTGAGLSLLTLSTSSLPNSVIEGLMGMAAGENDILGSLVDGSVGCFSIRPVSDKGAEALEEAFFDRLRPAMNALSERRFGGRVTLWLRAVHRPAAEIAHAADLITQLFDMPSTPITIASAHDREVMAGSILFPRVPPITNAFIEPVEREAPLIRMVTRGMQQRDFG